MFCQRTITKTPNIMFNHNNISWTNKGRISIDSARTEPSLTEISFLGLVNNNISEMDATVCSWGDLKDKFSNRFYFTQLLHAEDLVYSTLLRGHSLLFPVVVINTAAPRKFQQLLGKWASLGIEWKWWKLFLQCFPNIVRMILSLFHMEY